MEMVILIPHKMEGAVARYAVRLRFGVAHHREIYSAIVVYNVQMAPVYLVGVEGISVPIPLQMAVLPDGEDVLDGLTVAVNPLRHRHRPHQ